MSILEVNIFKRREVEVVMAGAPNKNNYITGLMKSYGENWIVALRPEDIQRSGKRIVKEMVRGQFNYEEVGKYFLDGKFLDNLINAVDYELQVNSLYFNAVSFYAQYYPQIPNISVQINHLNALCYIYNVVLSRLQAVKSTGNIGYLSDISALLNSYKNHLN